MNIVRCGLLALIACGLVLGGCSRSYGKNQTQTETTRVLYTVSAGDTIPAIARRYSVHPSVIIEANDITARDLPLIAGRQLVIPGGREVAPPPPPPAAPVSTGPEPSPSSDWYTPRSAWAVEPILMARINPMGGTPNRITVHHSNMPGDTDPDAVSVLRKIDSQHHKAIGRNGEAGACIGYHFIIATNGTVYEGRPLKYQGAHAGGSNNIQNIGVCLLGDYEHRPVPAVQKAALIQVLDRLCATYGISRSKVIGHKDFNTPGNYHTDCPGRYLAPIVQSYQTGSVGSETSTPSHAATWATTTTKPKAKPKPKR